MSDRRLPIGQKEASLSLRVSSVAGVSGRILDNKYNDINDLTGEVIGAAIEVHKTLGPGLLESIYEECLCKELEFREIPYKRQQELPIEYKGSKL